MISKELASKAVADGHLFGFIPHRLEIALRPELNNFPFNVMFMSWAVKDGKQISGTALYEPDFDTYQREGDLGSMRYHNVYGGDCHLVITYDEKNKRYREEKFVNGKSVSSAYGGDNWREFFLHVTMIGLATGERCEFETMIEEK